MELAENEHQKYDNDVEADLAAAIKEVEEKETPQENEDIKSTPEPQEEIKEPTDTPIEESKPDPAPTPPQSWSAAAKQKWLTMDETVRAEVLKREQDIHHALTRHDGDLKIGREMKEVIAPYMAQIQAEGATPVAAVSSLLNTAYVLRTGTQQQKRDLILNTAKQYGVDLGISQENEEYVDPTIAQLQNEIRQLRQMADPQVIESRLHERLRSDKVNSEIDTFASNPEHVHFETVRPLMASILNAGQAKDLKEAYDIACRAHPQVRSTLEAAQKAEAEAKRKQDIAAKKRAASSVTGSSAFIGAPTMTNPKSSVEDDLRAAFNEIESRV